MATKYVNESNVYKCSGELNNRTMNKIINWVGPQIWPKNINKKQSKNKY